MSKRNGNVSPDRKITQVVKTSVVLNQDEGHVQRTTSVLYSHSPVSETYSDESMVPEAVKEFCKHAPCSFESSGTVSRWIYSHKSIMQPVFTQIRMYLEDTLPELRTDVLIPALISLNAMVLDINTGIHREIPSTIVEDSLKAMASIPYGVEKMSYEVLLPYKHRGRLTITNYGSASFELIGYPAESDKEEPNE